ncbi:Hypothetical protein PHPALM_20499 [Phytophthora palmivora]|uniref:Transmembrane protein n=1 Tax=Phytophthora palmivora TaxID=4796 RepID=A0A2P4XEQ4_9STRA|nr:Hypothetical protein PHPALM_20499 [Phytophthora palmivora]
MRTSGGAGASHRRLRDATPGPLHPLSTLLLTLLLLCSLVAAESSLPPSQQPHEWSPHVTVSADGIATSRGTGRRRSDGLSITRSTPVESGIAPDAAIDDQAIRFTPARVDLGRMETCSPQRYYVGVENHGRVSVRLDGADFTHEGLSLATDVRGIRLDPGDKFNVQFVFLPKIFALDSFVHLELLNGSNWIGPRWPREGDEKDGDIEVPGKYDKQFDYARRADRGAWDMPAGTTSPLIKVSLHTSTPGVYFTYIHIAAGERRLLMVPVRLTVMKPGIHIEPKELDLGVLTDLHENEHREVLFTLYNAGVNPIEVLELKVLKSNLIVSAQLWGGSAVIPPRTQVLDALAVQIRVDRGTPGGACFALLLLKTNASSSELGQRKLKLYGRIVHGNLAFQLNETSIGVITPLDNMFYDDEGANNTAHENDKEQSVEVQNTPTKLVSMIGENSSMGIMAGTSAFRKVRLWNQFDCPVELQRVWVESTLPNNDEPDEVSVYRFNQSVVPAGSAWPKISLQISPTVQGKTFSTRFYSLMVETNVSLHRIQIHVYHGFLDMDSSRGLQNYSVSGYYHDSLIQVQNSSQACLEVPRGGLVTTLSPHINDERMAGTQGVQICRSLLFDLERVASHRSRTEVVKMINNNPVPISLKVTCVYESDMVDISIRAKVTLKCSNDSLDFAVNETTNYRSHVIRRDSINNDTIEVSQGNQFVLQPGYQVIFHVKVQAQGPQGELTVPVMSVETPIEVLHLHTRLQSVQGTVEPVQPAIVLPSMFPGRTKIIHLQYRNTFEHSVTPLMATISSSNLKLLSMRDAMAPKQVESVLDLLFSPAADSKCSNALFLADCLISQEVPTTDQTCEHLSDYGELVDEHDLAALNRRDAFWSRRQGDERQLTVEAQVHLQTDIMDDVAEVTIKALLERPLVTASAVTSLERDNNSSVFGRKEFELTELLGRSHIFVNVRNPSNISVQMELAIAEADQALFYSCKDELSAEEESSGKRQNRYKDISSSCLTEWRSAASDAVVLQRDKHMDIDVSPFYFQNNIVQVPAGGETQLGPIYYLPSKVQEVATTVFVRNDLSHIEPVSLFACSGKGTLHVSVDAPKNNSELTKVLYIARDIVDSAIEDSQVAHGDVFDYDGTLSFALTEHDEPTDYTQDAEIIVSNTGPFGLIINSLTVEGSSDISWTRSVSGNFAGEFLVTLEHLSKEDGKNGQMILPAGDTARIHVSFCANCFTTTVTNWLNIDTSDGIKRIQLQGTITKDAAFSCLHSRVATPLRYAFHFAWMIAAAATVISTLYTVFSVVHDAWIARAKHQVRSLNLAIDTEDPCPELAVLENHEDLVPSLDTPHSINRILEDMEEATFAPSARVVVTPAVSKLLEGRHKGLCSTVQNSENAHSNEVEEGRRVEREHSTTEVVNNPTALPSHDAVNVVAPPDATSKLILQDSNEGVAKECGNADASTSLSLAIKLLSVSGATDSNDSDSSSDESSSQSPETSPSHSTIVTEESKPNLSELSFGFSGSRLNRALESHQPKGTTSTEKTEGPFEVFKSLSERWRAQDWQDEPSGNFLGTIDDWNGTLSLNTLGQSMLTTGGRRDENVRSGNRSDSSSFLGASSRNFLDEFSTMTATAAPLLPMPKPNTKKAPPGFTPADAKPLEARAAFERLRISGSTTPAIATTDDNPLFASKLPLFGPALPPKSDEHVTLGGVGRIGSGRSKVLRGLDVSMTK